MQRVQQALGVECTPCMCLIGVEDADPSKTKTVRGEITGRDTLGHYRSFCGL